MKLVYLYPDGLKKVQTCSLVVQSGTRAKSSLAKTATDSVPAQKQQKTISSFSQNATEWFCKRHRWLPKPCQRHWQLEVSSNFPHFSSALEGLGNIFKRNQVI